jgi:hypothetical protein
MGGVYFYCLVLKLRDILLPVEEKRNRHICNERCLMFSFYKFFSSDGSNVYFILLVYEIRRCSLSEPFQETVSVWTVSSNGSVIEEKV